MRRGAALALGLALVTATLAPAQTCHFKVEGEITAIDLAAQRIVVDGYTIQIDSRTVIRMQGDIIGIGDLAIGMTVRVKGPLKGDVVYARRIAVQHH